MFTKEMLDSLRTHLRSLAQQQKLVERGWQMISLVDKEVQENCHGYRLTDRDKFFAGAHFIFDLLQFILDEDREITAADLQVMESIEKELTRHNKHLEFVMAAPASQQPT